MCIKLILLILTISSNFIFRNESNCIIYIHTVENVANNFVGYMCAILNPSDYNRVELDLLNIGDNT